MAVSNSVSFRGSFSTLHDIIHQEFICPNCLSTSYVSFLFVESLKYWLISGAINWWKNKILNYHRMNISIKYHTKKIPIKLPCRLNPNSLYLLKGNLLIDSHLSYRLEILLMPHFRKKNLLELWPTVIKNCDQKENNMGLIIIT